MLYSPTVLRGTSDEIKMLLLVATLLFAASAFASTFKVCLLLQLHRRQLSQRRSDPRRCGQLLRNDPIRRQVQPRTRLQTGCQRHSKPSSTLSPAHPMAESRSVGCFAIAAGNLYGITSLGGDPTCSCGTVFKLTKNGTLKVLHSLQRRQGRLSEPGTARAWFGHGQR